MSNQLSFSINVRDNASPALNSLKRQVSSLKSGINSLSSSSQSANNFIRSLNSGVSGASTHVKHFGGSVRGLVGAVAGLSVVRGIFNTITGTFDRAIQRLDTMDLFSQKITMITGSAQEASTALEHLRTSTKGTPYALDIAAKAVQDFVTRGMETSKATESVDIWMDAVSAYGKGTNEQFESVLDAIAKMRTKGTVEMRYLNRLFAAGINPVRMYAQATGMAAEDVQTALSEKTINTEDFLNVVETAMREGTNGVIKVQGMARQLATTWAATIANMTTAIARGWTDLISGADKFVSFFREGGLKGIVKDFGNTTESVLGAVGNSLGAVGTILSGAYTQLEKDNQAVFERVNRTVENNTKAMSTAYSNAGNNFKAAFEMYFKGPLTDIISRFLTMRETWSGVSYEIARGMDTIAVPFARFASEYLGATITGIEDIATAFGQWLQLKLPPFFDKVRDILNWLTEHRDSVVGAVKSIVATLFTFRVLDGIRNTIIRFNNSLKHLNDLLAIFTLGKIQVPTLENLVSGNPFSAKNDNRVRMLEREIELEKERTRQTNLFTAAQEKLNASTNKRLDKLNKTKDTDQTKLTKRYSANATKIDQAKDRLDSQVTKKRDTRLGKLDTAYVRDIGKNYKNYQKEITALNKKKGGMTASDYNAQLKDIQSRYQQREDYYNWDYRKRRTNIVDTASQKLNRNQVQYDIDKLNNQNKYSEEIINSRKAYKAELAAIEADRTAQSLINKQKYQSATKNLTPDRESTRLEKFTSTGLGRWISKSFADTGAAARRGYDKSTQYVIQFGEAVKDAVKNINTDKQGNKILTRSLAGDVAGSLGRGVRNTVTEPPRFMAEALKPIRQMINLNRDETQPTRMERLADNIGSLGRGMKYLNVDPYTGEKVTTKVKDTAVGAGRSAGGFIQDVLAGFRRFSGMEKGAVTKDVKGIGTSAKDRFFDMGRGIKNLGSSIADGFRRFGGFEKGAISSDFKYLAQTPSRLNTDKNGEKIFSKSMLQDVLGSLGRGVKNVATAPVRAVKGGASKVGQMFGLGAGVEQAAEKTGILSKALSSVSAGFAKVTGWIGTFIATVGGVVTAVVGVTAAIGALTAGLGMLNPGNAVSDGINSFFTTFGEWCSTFSQNAPILIQSFVSGLIQDLPQLTSQGVNLLLSIVNGIMTALPQILTVGVSVVSSLISGLLQVLPELVLQGFNAVGQFIAGIIQNLPNIISAGFNLLKTFIKGVLQNLPLLFASGVKLVVNIIKGIVSMVTQVGSAVIGLIKDGLSYVWNHPQEIWDSCMNVAHELWNALLSGLYKAADMFNAGWILDRLGATRPEMAQAGTDAGNSVTEGAQNAINSANLNLQTIVQNANTEQAQADAVTAGQDIGGAVTEGVDAQLQADTVDATAYGTETGTNYTDAVTSSIQEGGANVDTALSAVGQEGLANLNVTFNSDQAAQAAAGLMQSINTALNENAFTLYQSIAVITNNCLTQLAAGFANLPDDVPSAIATAMTTVAQEVGIKVTDICNNIKTQLITAKNDADLTTQQLATAISNNFATAHTSALASLQAMSTDVSTQYQMMRDNINTYLTEIEGYHTTYATNGIEEYKRIVREGLDVVKGYYNSFDTDVRNLLNNLSIYHKTIGQETVNNYAEGIRSQMQTAIDATDDLVQAVKEAFVKGLGIHSPSDITYWYGQMTGAGFIEGLTDSQLSEFAKTYLNEIVDAFVNGKFSADDLVDFLGEDSLKVIHAIQADPELLEKAMQNMPVPFGGSASGGLLGAAYKYLNYRSNDWKWSIFNPRVGSGRNPWCAIFVKAMADEAGIPWPNTWGVESLASWAKSTGRWEGLNGHPGDVAIMKSYGHVGILEQPLGGTSAIVVSGNTLPYSGGGNGVGVYRDLRHDMNGYIHIPGTESGLSGSVPATVQPEGADSIGYPLPHRVQVTSHFGGRASPGGIGSRNHQGVDLSEGGISGMPILSSLAGNVTQSGWNQGYGQSVTVTTGDLDILYGHMSQILAQLGQSVQKGQQIGLVGSTGNSTGPHLHFEMRRNGAAFDPLPYLNGASVSIGAGGYTGTYGRNLLQQIQDAYDRKYGLSTVSAMSTGYNPSSGVSQWTGYVQRALTMLGQPLSYTDDILYTIQRESGGDPNPADYKDSNYYAGHPSKGLMQTIPETFNAYRHPGLSSNILDPMANIYAGINYMIHRYGSIGACVNPRRSSTRGWYGYAVGTRYVPYDMMAPIHEGEAIIPAAQNPYTDSGGDYLADMFTSMFPDTLQETGFRRGALSGEVTTTNTSSDFNGNIVFNITNSSDVDGDRFVGNLEAELHKILQNSFNGKSAR